MTKRVLSKPIVSAVIPAAGLGRRLSSKVPKPYLVVRGLPLIVRTLSALLGTWRFNEVVVVADATRLSKMRRLLDRHGFRKVRVVRGGSYRAQSVQRGILALRHAGELVLVHDAARPLISKDVTRRTIEAAAKNGAAICAVPVSSTVKRQDPKRRIILGTEDRGGLCLAQTPQVFKTDLLLKQYRRLGRRAKYATDEAALFDSTRVVVRLVAGDEKNIKITTAADLTLFNTLLSKN